MSTYPAETFVVVAPATATQGSTVAVTVTGLEPAEKYTIAIGSTVLASGSAPATGPLQTRISIGRTAKGTHTLVATGQAANRTGSCSISIAPSTSSNTKRI